MKASHGIWLTLAGAVFGQSPELPAPAAIKINFEQHVEPVFEAKCYGCHGAEKQMAGLRLDRRQLALRGGDYGPVIIPGDSANSKLIHRLVGSQAGMQMPPTGALEPHEIAILRAWIDQGPDYGNSQSRMRQAPPKPVSPAFRAMIAAITTNDLPALKAAINKDKTLATAVDNTGDTALIHVAGRGSIDAMRVLLDAGAPVDARNRRGATALTWALADPAKVKLLLDRGAAVNGKTGEGRTALHIAAGQPGIPETFRLLMGKGADVNAADLAGFTPLYVAAGAGSEEYVRRLLEAGAKVNAAAGNGATPLLNAAMSGANSTVRYLLEKGADPKIVTKGNVSPLGAASYWGDVETMRQLIAKGAPVSLIDKDGYAPLTFAAYSEVAPTDAVRLLLRHGATAGKTADGETPASLAARRGATDVVRILNESTASADTSRIRAAVTKAFAPLEQQSPNFVRIGGCNSCHNQDLPLFAQSIARQRGIPAGGEFVTAPEGAAGADRIMEHSGLLGASSIGYGVMARVARNRPADGTTDAQVNYMLAHQEPDGRWMSRSNRQPLSVGDHHATAFGIFILRSYGRGARQNEVNSAIGRAVAWLEEHAPVSNQDAAMQLLGMAWGNADKSAMAKAAAALRARQNGEGGWSQLSTLQPDAYATGQALYALALAGVPASDPAYQRGVDFLLRTQAADGTWHVKARSKPVQPYFESGFPYGHDQWISAAGTSWAAMALSMAVDAPTASARR